MTNKNIIFTLVCAVFFLGGLFIGFAFNFDEGKEQLPLELLDHCNYNLWVDDLDGLILMYPLMDENCLKIEGNCNKIGGKLKVHQDWQEQYPNIETTFYFAQGNEKEVVECNIELSQDKEYLLGQVRGCDIGCIDYDLRINNLTWQTTEDEYDLLNSSNYQKCSAFCQERMELNK